MVRSCSQCQVVQSAPPVAPLNPWKWPSRPWARLHVDFAGPFQGKTFLLIIDAHSKWIEAMAVSSTSSAVVINELRTLFSRYGILETIVSDNGTGFTSREFEKFLATNGVKHLKSAPYHPVTNGLAERAVQIVKRALKKDLSGSVEERLACVLFAYRVTPQSTTGMAPDELLLGCKMRTRLDLVRPNSSQRVESKQWQQKQDHDGSAKSREFSVGDTVYVRNFETSDKWLPGKVTGKTGSVLYQVVLEDGSTRCCHIDQLRSRVVRVPKAADPTESADPLPVIGPEVTADHGAGGDANPPETESGVESQAPTTARTYPSWTRRPPERYDPCTSS